MCRIFETSCTHQVATTNKSEIIDYTRKQLPVNRLKLSFKDDFPNNSVIRYFWIDSLLIQIFLTKFTLDWTRLSTIF